MPDIEVPLPFELDMRDRFDPVLLVTAESRLQIERLAERDKVAPRDATALIKAQMPDVLIRKKSDFIINNNGCRSE